MLPSGKTSILFSSGFVLDLANPDASNMPVEDIATALAQQPRWGGACKPFYSVAEHSVFVSLQAPPELAFDALMHDAVEAITGDWPTPLKNLLGRDALNAKLAPIEAAFKARFCFRNTDHPLIKHADLVAQATELRDLLPQHWMDWSHLPAPLPGKIVPVGSDRAFAMFMDRFASVSVWRLKQ